MRSKRVEKFRKDRRKKVRKVFLLAVVMPLALVIIGYLVASVIILPAMSG